MGGHLALTGQCHLSPKINFMPCMSLKSRLLIGLEHRMPASDWSRGLVENEQRGTPYDMEGHLPLTGQCHLS